MGLRYSFEFITTLNAMDRLIRAITDVTTEESRQHLLQNLPFATDRGLHGVSRDHPELCLTFLFPPDAAVLAYNEDVHVPSEHGRLPVGCVWTSVASGRKYALATAAAATSGMSRLFEQSQSVRDTFSRIAQAAGCRLLMFNHERDNLETVWPVAGLVPNPPLDWACDEPDIDGYCLTLAGHAERFSEGTAS